MSANIHEHWNQVYASKTPTEVSWYQKVPHTSLKLIDEALSSLSSAENFPHRVIDVGGGASSLVDHLLKKPNIELCVLDIAMHALNHSMNRLGSHATKVQWVNADVSKPVEKLSSAWADVWHDRAVFHFLASPELRLGYAQNLARILQPRGVVVIATFALDGPTQCSDLDICRYDGRSIQKELMRGGVELSIESELQEEHTTPWGSTQSFHYTVLRRVC